MIFALIFRAILSVIAIPLFIILLIGYIIFTIYIINDTAKIVNRKK